MLDFKDSNTSALSTLGLLWSRLSPSWARRKIDSQLFLFNNEKQDKTRLPRGFIQEGIDTPEGYVNTYRTGQGPAVVIVHGWGGGAYQFTSLMRGLKECGFTAYAFDHIGHEMSANSPATLQQLIKSTNRIIEHVKDTHEDGLYAVVSHGLGCMLAANAKSRLIQGLPLFLISPIFNYKLYFLKKLSRLNLHPNLLKQYASRFISNYNKEYLSLELDNKLKQYSDDTVIAHDKNDTEAPLADSLKFVQKHPLTKILVTKSFDHQRIISSETLWHELKSHLNIEDTTFSFSSLVAEESA